MSARHERIGTARRGLYAALGLASVGMGVVGLVVPGLPTTVFLLLASWLFARSSPALHRRLAGHRVLGPYLEMARSRAMPLRAKVVSLAAMWGGIAASVWVLAPTGAVAPLLVVAAGGVGTAVLLRSVRTLPARATPRPAGVPGRAAVITMAGNVR